MVPLGLYVFAGGPIAVSEVFEKSVRAVLGAFENEHGRVELVAEMVVVVVVLVVVVVAVVVLVVPAAAAAVLNGFVEEVDSEV